MKLHFFIGYDSKEDIAYRVCKHSLLKHSSIDINVTSLKLDELIAKKLLVYFAIKNSNWDLARENISGMVGANPSKEICYFMSDIELGENSDKQKSDAWIMRAENASMENTWVCKITNQTQDEWSSLSNSGNYNSLVWTSHKMLRQNKI